MYHSRSDTDRRIIALAREHRALSKKRFTVIKLEKPIQRGWLRHFVLSEAARTRDDIDTLKSILEVINHKVVHHSKDFRKRKGRSRKQHEIEQPLRSIPIHEWLHKDYPRKWEEYFRYQLVLEWNAHWQPHRVFRQPYLYEMKIERNWLWYFTELDPDIETRLSEIDRWMTRHNGWNRYCRLKGRSAFRRYPGDNQRQIVLDHVHAQEISAGYDGCEEVDLGTFEDVSKPASFSKSSPSPYGEVEWRLADALAARLSDRGRRLLRADHEATRVHHGKHREQRLLGVLFIGLLHEDEFVQHVEGDDPSVFFIEVVTNALTQGHVDHLTVDPEECGRCAVLHDLHETKSRRLVKVGNTVVALLNDYFLPLPRRDFSGSSYSTTLIRKVW